MKSVLFGLGIVAIVFGSLLTFPAYIHWMVAGWAAVSLIAIAIDKPAWPWLIGGLTIVCVKQPGYLVEFWVLAATFLTMACCDCFVRRQVKPEEKGTTRWFSTLALLLCAAVSFYGGARWYGSNFSSQLVADNRPIVCLGDSLTDYGYPQELEELISMPVADFGLDGITTDDGIKMIPEILSVDPQLVVIELGGHDYNAEKKTREATQANLETLITAFADNGIAVILVEVPRGFISDPYSGLERELAAKYDLQLIDDTLIRKFIFFGPI